MKREFFENANQTFSEMRDFVQRTSKPIELPDAMMLTAVMDTMKYIHDFPSTQKDNRISAVYRNMYSQENPLENRVPGMDALKEALDDLKSKKGGSFDDLTAMDCVDFYWKTGMDNYPTDPKIQEAINDTLTWKDKNLRSMLESARTGTVYGGMFVPQPKIPTVTEPAVVHHDDGGQFVSIYGGMPSPMPKYVNPETTDVRLVWEDIIDRGRKVLTGTTVYGGFNPQETKHRKLWERIMTPDKKDKAPGTQKEGAPLSQKLKSFIKKDR